MEMDEILMAALDLGVCIYCLLWLMFGEADEAIVVERTNTTPSLGLTFCWRSDLCEKSVSILVASIT